MTVCLNVLRRNAYTRVQLQCLDTIGFAATEVIITENKQTKNKTNKRTKKETKNHRSS